MLTLFQFSQYFYAPNLYLYLILYFSHIWLPVIGSAPQLMNMIGAPPSEGAAANHVGQAQQVCDDQMQLGLGWRGAVQQLQHSAGGYQGEEDAEDEVSAGDVSYEVSKIHKSSSPGLKHWRPWLSE